jgi:hypothetical protein
MQQQTLATAGNPAVLVPRVPGDLRVAGWERAEIMAKTDGSQLNLESGPDQITISCDEDLILYLPRAASLKVEQVRGDASLQAFTGSLVLGSIAGDVTMHDVGAVTLGEVSGDTNLRNIGALTAEKLGGDFTLRVGRGVCTIDSIAGDASLRDVDGMVDIQNVGSDVYVRNVMGAVSVSAGADVALYLTPLPGQTYAISAGDDLILRLPPDAKAELHLSGGSPESIHVDFAGVTIPEDLAELDLKIGEQDENVAKMVLTAGDDLLVTSQADAWESAADFGVGMKDAGEWGLPPLPPLPPDFSERINRRVQAAMERAQSKLEAAGRRAEATGRRTEIKIEAAMRRAEAKARAAEVRARRGQVNMNIGRWNWDLSPKGPAAADEAVSDQERLTILRMLQEKKISMEEAEKLLSALEGKN